jgi:uncharacterized protein YdaU (DUF1376 family)
MMSELPYMPLFVSDFISDTLGLGSAETGAYLMLLMVAWRAGGSLPDDDTELAKYARASPRQWVKLKPKVMRFWHLQEGLWVNNRLTKEHQNVSKMVQSKRSNGSLGGHAKALKDKEAGLAKVEIRHGETLAPTPTPTLTEEDLKKGVSDDTPKESASAVAPATAKKGARLPDDWEPKDSHMQLAAKLGKGVSWMQGEADAMREWALGNANRAVARKASWDMTFNGWLRRAAERQQARNGNGSKPTRGENIDAAFNQLFGELTDDDTSHDLRRIPATNGTERKDPPRYRLLPEIPGERPEGGKVYYFKGRLPVSPRPRLLAEAAKRTANQA